MDNIALHTDITRPEVAFHLSTYREQFNGSAVELFFVTT
jgi:hypothetical protein